MRWIDAKRLSVKVETPHPQRRLPAFVDDFSKAIVLLSLAQPARNFDPAGQG
jgi:hypothetical protein